MEKPQVHIGKVSRVLLLINIVMLCIYFSWWLIPGHVANPILYALLFFGELYHIAMALTFWLTIWPGKPHPPLPYLPRFKPSIDIFIPVAGEPMDIIMATARAAKNMKGYQQTIYILNDGYAAKKDNWKDAEYVAKELGIHCITRSISKGAKAGNINNALEQTKGDIIVIFDADMVAHPDFLEKTIPYFHDKTIGFIQTPQFYKNASVNQVTMGAWEQLAFFYGAILHGKEKNNTSFICGTNVAIRRRALEDAGGMSEESIAEDFLTSLFVHQHGWKSYYVTEVLVEGLAPEDLLSYYKQQRRWARGSLELLFMHNPLFKEGLTWSQKIQYLSSALYYFNGIVVLIDIVMPIIFLFTGIQAVAAATTSFALFFIPFMFLNLYTLYLASDKSITFRAIAFSQSIWALEVQAVESVIYRKAMSFSVTSKQAQKGNYFFIVYPHVVYIILACIAILVGLRREGIGPSVVTNIAWILFNIMMFVPFIQAAMGWKSVSSSDTSPAVEFLK